MSDKRAYALFNRMADQFWRRRGQSVLQYERNLARVMPEADENQLQLASREGLRSYARYWCDAFRMPDWPLERIVNLPVEGIEHLDRLVAEQERIFFVAPHAVSNEYPLMLMYPNYIHILLSNLL